MKKIICCIIAIIFLISSAYADDPILVHIESYKVVQDGLTLYFNSNTDKEITEDQLNVSISGNTANIKSLQKFGSAVQGSTYLFMMDISGSISEDKMSVMKNILKTTVGSLGSRDNASVMTVGNSIVANPFTSDKEQLIQQINSVNQTSEDTNLYAATIKALELLNTDSTVQTKKCLIILSDGLDYYKTGYTREEVENKIKDSHLPVYTIALLNKNADKDEINASKVLGSFARISAGGLDLTYGLDKTSENDIAASIVQSIKNSYILTVEIPALSTDNDECYLGLSLEVEGKSIASDGYMIDATKIRELEPPKPSEEPSPNITPAPSVNITSNPLHNNIMNAKNPPDTIIIILAASAVALIIIAILVVIILKKKYRKDIVNNLAPEKESQNVKNDGLFIKDDYKISPFTLHLTKVGLNEGEVFTFILEKEMIIGRDPANSQMVFSKDELLSSRHCKISKLNDKIYLEDLNSTNGTYLNGVPVKQICLLEQDDIIMIGSMELRINW